MMIYDVSEAGFRPLRTTDLDASGGGAGSDRELVVTTYRCTSAFTGASVGDTITATQVIDVTSTPTTVGTIWRNQTTAADLASAPSAANLEIVGAGALTNAQLRSAPVDVSATALPLPSGAATSAAQDAGNTSLASIDTKLPAQATPGLLPVDTLGSVGAARQLAAGDSSANTALTASTRRISIHARGADIRYAVGTGAQTANAATSHFIASGERLDLDVPASSQIAVIRAGSTDGTLELSELA